MEIKNLDHFQPSCSFDGQVIGAGTTLATTYSIATVDYGYAFADAYAFAFGENTLANTHATAHTSWNQTHTSYLTKSVFKGGAYSWGEAIAADDNSFSYSKSESSATFISRSYSLTIGF